VVDALVVEVPQLLAQLVQRLRDDGGTPDIVATCLATVEVVTSFFSLAADHIRPPVTFVQREVHDLREAFHEFDVVINCTGIGSRWLCNDPHVRGLAPRAVVVRLVRLLDDDAMEFMEETLKIMAYLTFYGRGRCSSPWPRSWLTQHARCRRTGLSPPWADTARATGRLRPNGADPQPGFDVVACVFTWLLSFSRVRRNR
jgi:hypothetical protein